MLLLLLLLLLLLQYNNYYYCYYYYYYYYYSCCYFYDYYFEYSNKNREIQKKRKYLDDNKEYLFKTLLEDGYTNEEIVRLNYKYKLENIRLSKKLEELNIKSYEIKTVTQYPRLNKHGNFSEVYFNNREIIF